MLSLIKNINFFTYNKFAIIGICLTEKEYSTYNVILFKKVNDTIITENYYPDVKKEGLNKILNSNIPTLIHFHGKGIISKKVSNKNNLLNELVFNANPDDFCIYTVFQNDYNYASICRKEIIEKEISFLNDFKIKPIDYAIGPFVGVHLNKIITENRILIYNTALYFNEQYELIKFSKENDELINYTIDKDNFDSENIILLATLLNYLYPSDQIDYTQDILSGNKEDLKYSKIFNTLAISSLVFVLSALLLSYILLNIFNKKYIHLEQQLYQFNDSYSKIKNLEENVRTKRLIVDKIGIKNNKFISFFIHEVGNSLPHQIVLTKLSVNPLPKKIKSNEEVVFENNIILIEGNAKSSYYLSQWVRELKKFNWTKRIEILNLSTQNNKEAFVLKLTID